MKFSYLAFFLERHCPHLVFIFFIGYGLVDVGVVSPFACFILGVWPVHFRVVKSAFAATRPRQSNPMSSIGSKVFVASEHCEGERPISVHSWWKKWILYFCSI